MSTITYETTAGIITFLYPVLTIGRVPIESGSKQTIISVQHSYTVRSLLRPQNDTESLDQAIERYKAILLLSKGTLTIDDGQFSSPLIMDAASDLSYGPIPRELSIQKVHGGRSATITWTITTEQFPGDWLTDSADQWIDWIYTISTEIDSNFNARRTISGFLRLAPNHPEFEERTADAYRETAAAYFPVPEQPNGLWQRISSTWEMTKDLNALSFTIIDQQRYAFLPPGCLGGDIILSTNVSADGSGFFDLSGSMQGDSNHSRGQMQAQCFNIMESFFTNVLITIANQTGDQLYLKEEETGYRHHLRSNKVEFRMRWSIYGMVPGMNTATKLEYTATTAANWLAFLSVLNANSPPQDLGPYGSAKVIGLGEPIAPLIVINWEDKQIQAFQPGPTSGATPGGGETNIPGTTTPATKHLYFSQRNHFTTKTNNYIPDGGSTPIVIQIRPSEFYLRVSGEAERPDQFLTIPQPPYPIEDPATYPDPCATILECNVTPISPTVDLSFRITWSYLLRLHNLPASTLRNGVLNYTLWPYSPMLPDGHPHQSWDNIFGRDGYLVPFPNEQTFGLE